MEPHQLDLQKNQETNLLNSGVRAELRGAAFWAKLFAITNIAVAIISTSVPFFVARKVDVEIGLAQLTKMASVSSYVAWVFSLAAFLCYVCFLIFGYQVKQGLDENNNDKINRSFTSLRWALFLQCTIFVFALILSTYVLFGIYGRLYG